jgi:spermidine/putrescine transport system substrate-binding protein
MGMMRSSLLRRHLAALILSLAAAPAVAQFEGETLYLFNWSQYMDPSIIEAFETEYGVEVVENYFNSNGEMFAKLQAGGVSQYDVIVPSNYFVPRLIDSGLVQPLDHDKLSNLDNLLDKFIDPAFDPGNRYSAAYQWGTTGLVYDKAALGEVPATWGVLFDPALNSDQPFAVAEDSQVALGAACAYQGADYDCTSRDALEAAAREVLAAKQRDNFAGFIQGTPVLQQLVRGSVAAGMTYNGDYLFYKSEDPEGFADIEYVIPEEGAEIWRTGTTTQAPTRRHCRCSSPSSRSRRSRPPTRKWRCCGSSPASRAMTFSLSSSSGAKWSRGRPMAEALHEWARSLPDLHSQGWKRLVRGVNDRRAAGRHPTLATVDAQGMPQGYPAGLHRPACAQGGGGRGASPRRAPYLGQGCPPAAAHPCRSGRAHRRAGGRPLAAHTRARPLQLRHAARARPAHR